MAAEHSRERRRWKVLLVRNIPAFCAALCMFLLAGCPSSPILMVTPGAVDFASAANRLSLLVSNQGNGNLTWTAQEVAWMGVVQGWVPQDIPWLAIDAANDSGSITSGETNRVFLNAARTGLASGNYTGVAVQFESNGGVLTIPVSMTVSGGTGPGPGEGDLKIEPDSITIKGLNGIAYFTATNVGNALVHWYAEVTVNDPQAPADAEVQVAVAPAEAATAPNKTTTCAVAVIDPTAFDTSVASYLLTIRDKSNNGIIEQIPVLVDLVGPEAIAVDPGLLDYGEASYQQTFAVANVGDPNSYLDFAFFSKEGDDFTLYDVDADPLIAAVTATGGTEDVKGHPNNPWLNAREVVVTISRDGIEEDIEYREIWVCAVNGVDAEGNPKIDPTIEPSMVQLRVVAAPYVEGATNRSRPPSIMRFAFLLRDKRGIATDASDPLIRDLITFYIEEDDNPLDPDESSIFVTGPENLRYNIVLLLDFTGSMYNAGVNDPQNPLQPGDAIIQMKEAAKQFCLDLPSSYRVALMEYHDRDQGSRVIRGFDTNKTNLVQALDAFTLPPAEHGASEVFDAISDACNRLASEDPPGTLPFDDADVRSVVFISDGKDTSSIAKLDETIKTAQDNRVRLYPIGYSGRTSNPVNSEVLIQLASETGGHNAIAPEINDLTALLDTTNWLTFNKVGVNLSTWRATVPIRNAGESSITWRALESLPWLSVVPSGGSVPPLARDDQGTIVESGVRDITFALQTPLADGTYEGTVLIDSASGDATVSARATVAGGVLTSFVVVPSTDDAGKLWGELRGQVVLTYTSLFQEGQHKYNIEVTYPDSEGDPTSASFEKDGVFYPGDTRAGQVSLLTTGIQNGAAEVFVRTDYVPRNISEFRFRFIPAVPTALTPTLTPEQRDDLLSRLSTAINSDAVALAPDGLLYGWRLISEGNGVFTLIAPEGNLPYAAFGDLLKLTFTGLGTGEAFTIGFRVDNTRYYSPATETQPSLTKYFLYPGCLVSPEEVLVVSAGSDVAAPVDTIDGFYVAIDPEAPGIWDRDGDSWEDFDDSDPDDNNVGDGDGDGIPDLDDPTP